MSLLDWIARKQSNNLPATDTLRSVEEHVRSIQRKVAQNEDSQIQSSAFASVKQRDSLVMQRVLGQQPAKGAR